MKQRAMVLVDKSQKALLECLGHRFQTVLVGIPIDKKNIGNLFQGGTEKACNDCFRIIKSDI